MFVLTIDQRRSRRDVDRVPDLLEQYSGRALLRPFERTAGDEAQAVTDDAELVVDIALATAATGHWSVGIGVGPVEQPLPASTRAGRGPAFEAARRAVERAKNLPGSIAVDGAPNAEAALMLLSVTVSRRSAAGHAAVAAMRAGMTQSDAADHLGISKQAMSQRLSVAGWQAEEAGRRLATQLLEAADR
ncbi:hypothetical protein [Rhodococcus gannanensis]|jgi:hypothetical protein|uniref:MarR family transcriptional regulator n=1 Tax=Rhodococcus gannanensis TaxID=1960308 RepID=A0ABW4P691_9NOCA